jgi:large subunit ribosomal protein L32e
MTYRRPHFVREESWRYKRVKESWRSPRGKTSRVRRSKEGWPPVVKIGYSRPKAFRGRHPSGLTEVMVWRPVDLEHIDPKTQAARIAHTVGESKRVQILDQAKKANIRVLNPGVKKEAAVIPEAAPPTPEVVEEAKPALTEPAPQTATEVPAATIEVTEPVTEAKETEAPKEEPRKKSKKSKSSKKRSSKK